MEKFKRNPNIIGADVQSRKALVDVRTWEYFACNETGWAIWRCFDTDEPRSPQQITDLLRARYDVDPAQCAIEVESFVNALASRGMIDAV